MTIEEIISEIEDEIISAAGKLGYTTEDKINEIDAFINGANFVIEKLKQLIKE